MPTVPDKFIAALLTVVLFLSAILFAIDHLRNVPQCDVEIYQCSATESKSCAVGDPAPKGCEYIGTGKISCALVDECK